MSVNTIHDVEFGAELPVFEPDTRIENTMAFAKSVGWGGPRFEDHEGARKEGFPGALVPGIMGMGFLTSAIHSWAPNGNCMALESPEYVINDFLNCPTGNFPPAIGTVWKAHPCPEQSHVIHYLCYCGNG